MTRIAVRRESSGNVVGIDGRYKLRTMARIAVRRRRSEILVLVTRSTRHTLVRTGQWKWRQAVMVEGGIPHKIGAAVTLEAIGGKSCRCVIRVCRVRVIGPMTSDARRRCPEILILRDAAVTILAGESRVLARQRESRGLMLLDHVHDLPGFRGVTAQTVRAQFGFVHIGVA